MQLQFTLYDPANTSASPQQVLAKLSSVCGIDSPFEGEGGQGLERTESGDLDDEEADLTEVVSETDEARTPETAEKKRRRRRMAILRRKAKLRGYEFTNGSDVAGVLFIEIQKITDLPPERNGMLKAMDVLRALILQRMFVHLGRTGLRCLAHCQRLHDRGPITLRKCVLLSQGKSVEE